MRHVLAVAMVIAVAACAVQEPAAPAVDDEVAPSAEAIATATANARTAADRLAERLRDELMAAMRAGGPVAAVGVCKDRAPAIAADVQRETGVDIERTAERVRNPGNAPSEWAQTRLNDFAARRAAGEVWEGMEAAEVQDGVLVFMRPIPMGDMCVACHGGPEEVAAETAAAIDAAYPQDAARGFAPGELRGAFIARAPLDSAPAR